MIQLLEEVIPVPEDPKNAKGDWAQVEKELGIRVPEDYRKIIETYGDHGWNDFISVFNPFSDNRNLNLASKSKEILKYENMLRDESPHYYPIAIFPEKEGIFPWAVTDNGDYLFWITKGDCARWPTMIRDSRAPEFEVHFMETCMILYHIFNGTLRSMILPVNA